MAVDTNSCRLLFDNVFHFAAEDADPEYSGTFIFSRCKCPNLSRLCRKCAAGRRRRPPRFCRDNRRLRKWRQTMADRTLQRDTKHHDDNRINVFGCRKMLESDSVWCEIKKGGSKKVMRIVVAACCSQGKARLLTASCRLSREGTPADCFLSAAGRKSFTKKKEMTKAGTF
jgi:hypothetical protein